MKEERKKQFLWAIFIFGLFLLNYPVLAIYDIPERWLGIPLLYLMVFGIWLFLIIAMVIFLRKSNSKANV
ncbi:hypothetical protein OU792_05760 [Algoriphagus sp. NF]|jgi:heme/copper-type cytochrome/quinol oxidase subunit 2|uniref:hypothetical protein n=1 Tax=Algoriphagus sp. NF TaxID=2992756 RepID=UPI0010662466|nr:hypothetical protein [Algoriphagus sp. NF]MDE0559485.1 hypothetical protein [Algoriphagus sp. NF]